MLSEKNIQDLARAQDPNRIADVEYQVGELENVVGATSEDDFIDIQFLSTTNKIRFVIKTSGNITYDKSVTLS